MVAAGSVCLSTARAPDSTRHSESSESRSRSVLGKPMFTGSRGPCGAGAVPASFASRDAFQLSGRTLLRHLPRCDRHGEVVQLVQPHLALVQEPKAERGPEVVPPKKQDEAVRLLGTSASSRSVLGAAAATSASGSNGSASSTRGGRASSSGSGMDVGSGEPSSVPPPGRGSPAGDRGAFRRGRSAGSASKGTTGSWMRRARSCTCRAAIATWAPREGGVGAPACENTKGPERGLSRDT